MKMKSTKLFAAALTGIIAMSCSLTAGISASAADVTDTSIIGQNVSNAISTVKNSSNIGADGYENYNKGTYQCVSVIGAWLRSKPNKSAESENLYIISTDECINVTKTDGRWGYAEIKASDGTVYKGWTSLTNFLQTYDEPQRYVADVDTYLMADPWTGYTSILGTATAGQSLEVQQIFQNQWVLVSASVDTTWDTHETVSGWVDINDISVDTSTESDDTTWYYVNTNYTDGSNWDIIYRYLRNELGFNSAVTQAILTNIEYESGWNPNAWCVDTNGLISYGICQWNGGRYDALQSYCANNNLDYTSLYGQLEYLKYELTSSYYNQYLTMFYYEDSADGCMDAAYYWASKFEVCSSRYWSARASSAYYEYDSSLT